MKISLLTAALLGALSAPLLAQQAAAPASNGNTATLDPVVVTATRTPVDLDHALASVTVITREDIDRLQPASLIDLLQNQAGIAVAQSGGIGQQSSLFVRGTNSDHTLVLVDGIRIGSITAGIPALEQIPVDQIERIEIVRGPRSSLYGADAIGGVIQIFTRHGTPGGALAPSLSLTAGSHHFLDGEAGLSGGTEHAWFNASLGGEYTSGIPACRIGAAELGVGCFVDDPRNDPYRNWNGAFSGGYRWDDGTELSAMWLRSKSDIDFAGSPYGGNEAVNGQQVGGAKLAFSPLPAWLVTLSAGQSRDNSQTYYQGTYDGQYDPRTPTGYADSRRNQASWQNDITLGDGQLLTLGADGSWEHIDSDTGYLDSNRGDTGEFAQYQAILGRNDVQVSARHDHNDQFGNHDTGALAWGYQFDHGLKLAASYGNAFHAPTFNDLYYPYGYGNPDLKPETSHSAELDLDQQLDGWNWGLSTYQTQINQLITLNENYVPMNISRARIRGVEGQLGVDLAGWRVQGNLTWLQPRNESAGADHGNWLPRRPGETLRVDVDRRFGAFGVGATFEADGKRYDDTANQYRLGGYTTLDLRASWAFTRDWQLQARLANVFDRQYETAYYYNQLGRTAYLTLRYSPAVR